MAPAVLRAPQIANPLVTVEQLSSSSSQLDGVPADLEDSIRFAGARLTQAAGILLRLPQEVVAQAIVAFTRFWCGSEGGSLRIYGAKDISAACLYLIAKLSPYPRSPRSVINVYAYLDSPEANFSAFKNDLSTNAPESYYVSEGTYQARRAVLFKNEACILRTLGFQTHVSLPYTLCVNYLQALEVFADQTEGSSVARRAFAHLNSALLSPQQLYLTYQPACLATAAIYLAAREVGVKLPAGEWWEVFDTDREELGFLVVAMRSMEGFALEQKEKWGSRKIPMSVEELKDEIERRNILNGGG